MLGKYKFPMRWRVETKRPNQRTEAYPQSKEKKKKLHVALKPMTVSRASFSFASFVEISAHFFLSEIQMRIHFDSKINDAF